MLILENGFVITALEQVLNLYYMKKILIIFCLASGPVLGQDADYLSPGTINDNSTLAVKTGTFPLRKTIKITGLQLKTYMGAPSLTPISPITYSSGSIGIQLADSTHPGYLSFADWRIFKAKQNALGYTAANDANVVHQTGSELSINGAKGWNGAATFNNDVTLSAGSLFMNDGQYIRASSGNAKINLLSSGGSNWLGDVGSIQFGNTGTNSISFTLANPSNGVSYLQDFGHRKLMQNGANATSTGSQRTSFNNILEASTYISGAAHTRKFSMYHYASTTVADSTSLEFGYEAAKKIAFTQSGDLAFLTNAPRILDQFNNTHVRFLSPTAPNSTSLWLYNGNRTYSLITNDPNGSANLALTASPTNTDYGFVILGSHIKLATDGTHPSSGTATLSAGTVTVSTTRATTTGKIFVTAQNCSSCGSYSIGTRVVGTSFVINSSNGSDASIVAWWLVE